MSRKNRTQEENARREKIRELLQLANIGSMDDIQSLFKETIAEFMENGLEAELDDELGYGKYDYLRPTFRSDELIANHALIAHELQWKGSDLYRICGSTMLFGGAVSTLLLFSEHKQILMCNQ